MIEFMIIAAPRSGTAWAANWLTTDRTFCLHDPLFRHTPAELDTIRSERLLGIACTGSALWRRWLAKQPARKVILHRDFAEINASAEACGFPPLADIWDGALDRIEGMHVPWTDLFEKPREIWQHLTGLPFDAERHALLADLAVERRLDRIEVQPAHADRLMREFRAQSH